MTACEAMTAAAVARGISGISSFRIRQQQRALAEIVEHQRRQRNRKPRKLNRGVTEMTEIGIQCFTPRDGQKDGAQHQQPATRILGEEPNGMRR